MKHAILMVAMLAMFAGCAEEGTQTDDPQEEEPISGVGTITVWFGTDPDVPVKLYVDGVWIYAFNDFRLTTPSCGEPSSDTVYTANDVPTGIHTTYAEEIGQAEWWMPEVFTLTAGGCYIRGLF